MWKWPGQYQQSTVQHMQSALSTQHIVDLFIDLILSHRVCAAGWVHSVQNFHSSMTSGPTKLTFYWFFFFISWEERRIILFVILLFTRTTIYDQMNARTQYIVKSNMNLRTKYISIKMGWTITWRWWLIHSFFSFYFTSARTFGHYNNLW